MALDTNIALGVKPVEQPNMLAQMGQMMQIRQAQQEYESQNALSDSYRQAYASGKFDPQAVIRGLVQSGQGHLVPKVEAQMLKAEQERATTKKTQVDTLGKEYENARVGLTNITDEAGYYDWVKSSFSNPAIASHLTQLGITPEKALANAQAAVAKEGLSTAIAKSAMGIGKFIEQDRQLQNSVKTAQISAAPGHRQATLAETRYADELANPKLTPVQGMMPIPDPNAPGGMRMVETFAGFNPRGGNITPSQVRAPAAAPTVANSLATQYPAPVVNNALNPNFITQPSSPVVPSAAAVIPNTSAVAPSVALPNTPAQAAIFKPKPSPQAEKQAQDEIERARGKGEVANIIGGLASKYNELATTGGMTSTKKGIMENIGSYLANTALGQEAGKMTATQEQSLRNEIRAQSPVLLQGIKKATGMTAKEMDSNADVKRWMEAMGSTTFDVQSTLGILKSLNAQFGSGNEIPAAPAKTGNIASDPAIQTLINKYSK